MAALYPRYLADRILDALTAFRVVVVNGPRQSGKSTLLTLLADAAGAELVSLDDRANLRAARTDPAGFVQDRGRPLFIDEVQRGGDPLVLAIKSQVDRDPRPGRFVVSGSSRFLTVPTLSESLAGRARIIDLWPLSQGEIRGRQEHFVDRVFSPGSLQLPVDADVPGRRAVMDLIAAGGFPAVQALPARHRPDWFGDYSRTLVERDLTDIRRVRDVGDVAGLLRLAAAWTGQELNAATVARAASFPEATTREYLALLEAIYVFQLISNWRPSFVAKSKQRPKLHAVDTGLACDALGLGADALARPGSDAAGPLLESFVVNEIIKQQGWNETRIDLRHFRDRTGREIDVILQDRAGRVVAIEVKAAVDVDERDTRWLVWLRDQIPDRFVRGIVLHLGSRPIPLGDRMQALPVSALWNM